MAGNFFIDWASLAISLFNTLLLFWLGLTVLFNAERRVWGVILAVGGLFAGAAFFASHSIVLSQGASSLIQGFSFWWHVGWAPLIAAPFAWYLLMLWYCGHWDDLLSAIHMRRQRWLWFSVAYTLLLGGLLLLANPLPSMSPDTRLVIERLPSLGAVPLTVTLGDRSQRATAYVWTYGDGITGTATTTHTHVYTAAGVYTLTLRVSNLVGTDTLTKTGAITTYYSAVAGFTASPRSGLGPLAVTFTNTSQYATGYTWDYGDGVTSTVSLATHSHTYTTPGVYTATLTAQGPYDSNTYTRTSYITVYGQPVASFGGTPQAGVAPLLVSFNAGDGKVVFSTFRVARNADVAMTQTLQYMMYNL